MKILKPTLLLLYLQFTQTICSLPFNLDELGRSAESLGKGWHPSSYPMGDGRLYPFSRSKEKETLTGSQIARDWLKSQTQEKLEQVSKMQEEEMAEEGGKGVTEAKALDLEEKRKFKPRVDTPIPTQILYGLGVAAAMFGSYELLKLAWAYASKKRNESVESQYETKMGLPPGSLKKQGYFK